MVTFSLHTLLNPILSNGVPTLKGKVNKLDEKRRRERKYELVRNSSVFHLDRGKQSYLKFYVKLYLCFRINNIVQNVCIMIMWHLTEEQKFKVSLETEASVSRTQQQIQDLE